MRYNIEKQEYEDGRVRVSGWAIPEHQGDPLHVFLKDADGQELNVFIAFQNRPDVAETKYGKAGYDLYGFSFEHRVADLRNLELRFEAEEFEIDFARLPVRVGELADAYKKNKRHFGRKKRGSEA